MANSDFSKLNKNEAFQRIQQRAEAAREVKQPPPEQKIQLPLWPELERALPNHLARSSLFSPVGKGRRKMLDRVQIASRDDVRIIFSGKQLDMADCDVFMQVLQLGHKVPLGERIRLDRAEFLRAIGRSVGKNDYIWLHTAIQRLFSASLEIEVIKKTGFAGLKIGGTPKSSGLHLINGYDHDPDEDSYWLSLDKRIVSLFSNREFALIDWQKRNQIEKRVDIAKWLQNYIATHDSGIHRISLRLLKQWMDYSSPIGKFKEAISEALEELERLEIIAGPRLELSTRKEQQAVWTKL